MPGQSSIFDTWLSLSTAELLDAAWQVRRDCFGSLLYFAVPGAKSFSNEYYCNQRERFPAISITGANCALNCEHCRGKLLGSMVSCPSPEELLATARKLKGHGCQGILVSGGADRTGAVPLMPFLEAIKEIKSWGFKVLVHTGLAPDAVLAGLKEAGVDQVLVDIIGDQETIRDVYHLDYGPEDYQHFLKACRRYQLPVAPHIVIGLRYGRIDGEIEALRIISSVQPKNVVIVVLVPINGTAMAGVVPPSAEDCGRIIALARLANPNAHLSLGCAKPAGHQRLLLERYALQAGINAIAYPSVETIALAEKMKLVAKFTDLCCTLTDEQF